MKKRLIRFPDIVIPSIIPRIPYITPTSPITIGITVFMAFVVITAGVLFSVFVSKDIPPMFPKNVVGISFTAPSKIGEQLPVEAPGIASHTYKLLANGTDFDKIIYEGMNLSPNPNSSITEGILVNASSSQTGILTCANVIFENVSAPTFTMTDNIVAYSITGNSTSTEVDGNSITISASTTVANIAPSSSLNTASYVLPPGANPDKVIFDLENQNATCNTLKFKDIRSTGPIVIRRLKAGNIHFDGGKIGEDDGVVTNPDFFITATVNDFTLTVLNKPTLGSR